MKCKGPINRLRMLRTRGLFGPLAQRVSRTLCLWSPGYAYGAGGALSGPQPWPYADPYLCCDYSQATIEPGPTSTYTGSPVFTRASEATVVDYQGKLVTVPADVPRFHGARWDGSQWHATTPEGAHIPGIAYLCENAATNYVPTANLLASSWAKPVSGPNVIPAVPQLLPGQGPGGADAWQIAFSLSGNTSGSNLQLVQCGGPVDDKTYTSTLWIRKVSGPGNRVYHRVRGDNWINITSDWVKYTITSTTAVSAPSFLTVGLRGTSITNQDITIQVALPQLEEGAISTSYIPTSGAAATRAADSLTYSPMGTPNQVIIDGQVNDNWDGVVPVGEHSRLTVFAPPLDAADLQTFLSKDWSCAAQASPIVNPPPPALLGPFTAIDAQYWLDPDADEVLFDLFPPTGEPDLRIAYADLPDALADYGEYLAIIQAKIAEVEGL